MYFVSSPDAPCIPVISIPEHFKSLVDKYIVYQEIGCAIGHNSKADRPPIPEGSTMCQVEKCHTDHSVKNKKGVITLKPGIVILSVVVCMEMPQEAVHNILVGKPGHEFHEAKGGQENQDPIENIHVILG